LIGAFPQDLRRAARRGACNAASGELMPNTNPAANPRLVAFDLITFVAAALALHGTRDRPGRLEAFEGMDDLFTKGLEKVVVPGAGHFVHVERPTEVNRRIVEFFQTQ
jgi:pimeloyl-ACP methyl ester carboxylesterase